MKRSDEIFSLIAHSPPELQKIESLSCSENKNSATSQQKRCFLQLTPTTTEMKTFHTKKICLKSNRYIADKSTTTSIIRDLKACSETPTKTLPITDFNINSYDQLVFCASPNSFKTPFKQHHDNLDEQTSAGSSNYETAQTPNFSMISSNATLSDIKSTKSINFQSQNQKNCNLIIHSDKSLCTDKVNDINVWHDNYLKSKNIIVKKHELEPIKSDECLTSDNFSCERYSDFYSNASFCSSQLSNNEVYCSDDNTLTPLLKSKTLNTHLNKADAKTVSTNLRSKVDLQKVFSNLKRKPHHDKYNTPQIQLSSTHQSRSRNRKISLIKAPIRRKQGQKNLVYGLTTKNYEVARRALEKGEDPNVQIPYNMNDKIVYTSPLLIAAETAQLSILNVLLKHGAVINCVNSHGQTALHLLCLYACNITKHIMKDKVSRDRNLINKNHSFKSLLDLKNFINETVACRDASHADIQNCSELFVFDRLLNQHKYILQTEECIKKNEHYRETFNNLPEVFESHRNKFNFNNSKLELDRLKKKRFSATLKCVKLLLNNKIDVERIDEYGRKAIYYAKASKYKKLYRLFHDSPQEQKEINDCKQYKSLKNHIRNRLKPFPVNYEVEA